MTHSGPGRPKYEIPEEHLLDFKSLGFTWNAIADVLLVSRWTLRRRVLEYGITDLAINRSSHQRCSMKKRVLRNFTKFTGSQKTPVPESLF